MEHMTEKHDDMPGDDLDDLLDLDDQAAREALKREIRTRGAVEAYRAALAVCRDPRAPAPARATSAGLVMRAAGLLTGRFVDEESTESKAIGDLTPAELDRELARLIDMNRRADRTLKRAEEQDQRDGENGGGALD